MLKNKKSKIASRARTSLEAERTATGASERAVVALYDNPLPSARTGPLYNAFSYPTKISPEAIAVFIATHTEPGATVLDTFAGSGTTGLATLLCDKPTQAMLGLATKMGLAPKWGARKAHLFEIGTLGSFVSRTLCAPPDPTRFAQAAVALRAKAQAKIGWIYETEDPAGAKGHLRHSIWSEILICPSCAHETSYWDAAVRRAPLALSSTYTCEHCKKMTRIDQCERAAETVDDDFGGTIRRRRRVPVRIYGTTGSKKWFREPSAGDAALFRRVAKAVLPTGAPDVAMSWGDLYRTGYHTGIKKLHHFYTRRNFLAIATLWELVDEFEPDLRDALRLLILSYNSTHSTLMTRVVVKKNQTDFVLTGSQSGVLYVSGLPVEKNVLEGITRKAKSFVDAFALIHGSRSTVSVHNQSSAKLSLRTSSIDYVFTDPPFGGYIPYAEINQINELWLGMTTDRAQEIIVSAAQGKDVGSYANMMGAVFSEIARVLKPGALATVVFHSAHSDVWRALTSAYAGAGLSVRATSVLDKIQASFKQVVSDVAVKGDPLLLLSKAKPNSRRPTDAVVIADGIIASAATLGESERDPQRLYSRFVGACLERGIEVGLDAREFYGRAKGAIGVPA
jgi:16S rRNA G966 N2-methylase RsmD